MAGRWLTLWISSPDSYSERRLGSDLTISQLKNQLEVITGISVHHQVLRLEQTSNLAGHGSKEGGNGEGPGVKEIIAHLDQEDKTLEHYGAKEWNTIRVDSMDPNSKATAGQFTDVSKVEKFELTTEEYEARTDTVRTYKRRHQLGRFAPSIDSPHPIPEPLGSEFILGARCAFCDDLEKRGSIRFIGSTEFGAKDESMWIGIELDEPIGKSDGSVDGTRYFETSAMKASFVRPDKILVGDYPIIDPFASDEEM